MSELESLYVSPNRKSFLRIFLSWFAIILLYEKSADEDEEKSMKKFLVLPLAALSLLMSVSPAFAGVNPRAERARAITEMRCDTVDARSKLIIGRYDQNYPRHVANYKKVAQGVKTLADKLKSEGKDTAKLEAVLTTFNQKVLTFDQQAAAVVDQLKVAQQYACGQSQGKYAEEIKKAHDLAVTAHATLLDLRSYYQNNVRPEIKSLRSP